MSDRPPLPRFLNPFGFIALCAAVLVALSVLRGPARPPARLDGVIVDHVPPDACLAFYGPGPCREHGMTVTGSTDAVAGPPPESWRGKVQAQPSREPVRLVPRAAIAALVRRLVAEGVGHNG